MNLNLSEYDFGREIMDRKNGHTRYMFDVIKKAAGFMTGNFHNWSIVITANDYTYAGVKKMTHVSVVITFLSVAVISLIVIFIVRLIPSLFTRQMINGTAFSRKSRKRTVFLV